MEKEMNSIFKAATMVAILALPIQVFAQKLIVTALSHNTQEFDHAIPQHGNRLDI